MRKASIRDLVKDLLPYAIRDLAVQRQYRRHYPQASIHMRARITSSSLGKHVRIGREALVSNSVIADYSYVGQGTVVQQASIGKFCSIAPGGIIGLGGHPSRNFVSTHPIFYLHRPEIGLDFADGNYLDEFQKTKIGNDIWIGAQVAIKDGISIADGAIVGAGAVVTKDVPPYAIVGGVPAKLIRYRFDPRTIQYLLKLRWWDKDESWLRDRVSLFRDVSRLMELEPRL